MMTVRKRVGPLPTHRLAVRHSVDYSSSDPFTSDDSSETSSNSSSDNLFDYSSGHSSSDHSSPTLPSDHLILLLWVLLTRRVGPLPRLRSSPTPGAMSPARADILPPPKRIRSSDSVTDLEDCLDESSELAKGIDFRVVVEAVAREEVETSTRGPVEVRVERVTHPIVDPSSPSSGYSGHLEGSGAHNYSERSAECCSVGEDQTMPNTRSGAMMTREAVNKLIERRVAKALEARDAARNLEPPVEGGGEQGDENGDNYEGENGGGNSNGGVNGNGGNKNGGGNGNGNDNGNGNGNGGGNGYNFGGLMTVAREYTYQDFLKCQPLNFNGT
ncbi:hypothetical protein Tco_0755697 [Tanacetum coccineum]